MKIKPNKKTFIIGGIILVVIIIIAYLAFSEPSFEEDQLLVSDIPGEDADLIEQSNNPAIADVIQSEAFFLQQITQLQRISLEDISILNSAKFDSLIDNTVTLRDLPVGRDNPFAPINASTAVITPPNQDIEPTVEETPEEEPSSDDEGSQTP